MGYGVIILAAGDSKRMRSDIPKVLHKLAGRPILSRSLSAVFGVESIKEIVIVGGSNIETLQSFYNTEVLDNKNNNYQIDWAHQQLPLGTANAVMVGLSKINQDINKIIVLSGDIPLISANTLNKLISNTNSKSVGIITGTVANPQGLGRIIRDSNNNFLKIAEEVDASNLEKKITEVNVGIYLFPKEFLVQSLPKINNHNRQKEYYLTDVMALAVAQNISIVTTTTDNSLENVSVNTRQQLIALERQYQVWQANYFIEQGVTILDPSRFDIRGEVEIAPDVEIDINVILAGKVVIAKGAKIGANCYIKDTIIGPNVIIEPNTIIDGAIIYSQAIIGPFARIRPKTNIAANAKIGNFVEIKAAIVGEKSKINHLSYIGDAIIGSNVNIGAGSITCNYDGANKHVTVIEDNVLIGSACQLIAPITVEKNATLAAGTTLIQPAPASKLTLNKKNQYSVNWQRPVKKQSAKISDK